MVRTCAKNPGGRVVLRSCSLKSLIVTAFNLGSWQVSGGEPWINENLYDIEAKPPQDSPSSQFDLRFTWWRIEDPRLRQMIQALLIDRFHLKLDSRSGTGVVYLLEANPKTPGSSRLRLRPRSVTPEKSVTPGTNGPFSTPPCRS